MESVATEHEDFLLGELKHVNERLLYKFLSPVTCSTIGFVGMDNLSSV